MIYNDQHALIYQEHINEYIFSKVPKETKVLDIGCNAGKLGYELIKQKKCEVYGLDYSAEVISEASKKLTRAIVFDLESGLTPFADDHFDVIILGDILEHLKWPNILLANISKLLTADGFILASLPNVANIKNRLRLLFGNWDYTKDGILDITHLRFFTKKTIIEMFEEHYKVAEVDITPGIQVTNSNNFNYKISKIYPTLFAKQFIIKATKK
jgi:methionine biosynthesis protein MetW